MNIGILSDKLSAPSTARDGVKSDKAVISSAVIDKETQGVYTKTRYLCVRFIGHFQFALKPAAKSVIISP